MMSTYSNPSVREEKRKWAEEVMQNVVPRYLVHENDRIRPDSQMKEILISDKVRIKIGSQLQKTRRKEIIDFLQKNVDIFAESTNT